VASAGYKARWILRFASCIIFESPSEMPYNQSNHDMFVSDMTNPRGYLT
jgi:hypothetical protein